MKPTLLILAAGMGSRFGGLKQLEPLGPAGEAIIDYSVFDAIRAGFGKVVFVIRKHFADGFKEKVGNKFRDKIRVEYVFQELDDLPEGFSLPEERKKPWGTAHAILVAKDKVKEPFCALNADDFYGFNAFRVMAGFLTKNSSSSEFSMVGYKLKNTLSEHGSVSRGICEVNEKNLLKSIVETTKILKKDGGIVSVDPDGNETPLGGDETVSMNIWGFKPSIFPHLEKKFIGFLKEEMDQPKSEMLIPSVVFELIEAGSATVEVLETNSPWFGVTYKEDTPVVIRKIRQLIEKGDYPEKLVEGS